MKYAKWANGPYPHGLSTSLALSPFLRASSTMSIRRRFATELADREVGREVIQVALGHENLETTRDYV